jgi:hypothetical protein
MATRVHDLAVHIRDAYDGDAARVWADAETPEQLRANLEALPGLGGVDSLDALHAYQAAKKVHKKEWAQVKV